MEVGIFILVTVAAMFFTYLSFGKTVDQTVINQALAGALWAIASGNSLVLNYYIPNGSTSSYTAITKNGEYWQIILCVAFGLISAGIFIQLALDRVVDQKIQKGVI